MIRELTDGATTIDDMEAQFQAGVRRAFDDVYRVSASSLLKIQRLYPKLATGKSSLRKIDTFFIVSDHL